MQYKLTEFSHGAGCGCKLSPGVLSEILESWDDRLQFPNLLVGNESKDDAAVVDLDGQTAIVSTTDFFMPIVDDPEDFGGIAAANAISDIYAMGGTPLVAIAILGWPVDKIPPKVAGKVLAGARKTCLNAGIALAGGHSIDAPEPIFGLAVTGKVAVNKIKKNIGCQPGDVLFLTKPLGIGLVTTAQKRNIAIKEDLDIARKSMLEINKIGQQAGDLDYVHAMTDVTGFGLAGHLLELCEGSGVSASLQFSEIPMFPFVGKYIEAGCIPGGTKRNWDTYGHNFSLPNPDTFKILADPQTSGGLLIAVDPGKRSEFSQFLTINNIESHCIGTIDEERFPRVKVVD
ncbi:MAG: selenide, water dikinase SelD [Saprospiraceae bacterium]|nr:selenide, water dikinase SelD [Saprospiraceae bacterium]